MKRLRKTISINSIFMILLLLILSCLFLIERKLEKIRVNTQRIAATNFPPDNSDVVQAIEEMNDDLKLYLRLYR